MDSHQGQILHGAVCAGPRVHVWQVRGGDQPAVLAAGVGLHHGAGGHGGDAADLAPRLQVPHFRQGRRLLTTSEVLGVKLQHSAQKNGYQCSLNSKRLQCNGGYLNLPGIVFNQMVSLILNAIIIIHFLNTSIQKWKRISQTFICIYLAIFVVNLECSTLLICQNAQRLTLFYYKTRFIRHLKYYFSQLGVNAEY